MNCLCSVAKTGRNAQIFNAARYRLVWRSIDVGSGGNTMNARDRSRIVPALVSMWGCAVVIGGSANGQSIDEWRARLESGAVGLPALEEAITAAAEAEDRGQMLDLYVQMAGSEVYYPEFPSSYERLKPHLTDAEADHVTLYLAGAHERNGQWDLARDTVDTRLAEGGSADTDWGFALRYHSGLLAYKMLDPDTASLELESLYTLGDEMIPEDQAGRLRRQLVDIYRKQGRWEDAIQMGNEALAFTPQDDPKILHVLYCLGSSYQAVGDYGAAVETIGELVERVNQFFPDATARKQPGALAYTRVEAWLMEVKDEADAWANARSGPVRAAIRDGIDRFLEVNSISDTPDGSRYRVADAVAPAEVPDGAPAATVEPPEDFHLAAALFIGVAVIAALLIGQIWAWSTHRARDAP
jgi:tetratricopeptide (TPR) repeat protein